MKTIKHKKRKKSLGKKSSIREFISENLTKISMAILFLLPFFNIGYLSQISKELYLIPFFYFSFNHNKISFSSVLTVALLKDFSEINYIGLNIFLLTSTNFFLHFQSSIKFSSSINTILTIISSTAFIIVKSLTLYLINSPLNAENIFHTILLNIILTPIIIKIIRKIELPSRK